MKIELSMDEQYATRLLYIAIEGGVPDNHLEKVLQAADLAYAYGYGDAIMDRRDRGLRQKQQFEFDIDKMRKYVAAQKGVEELLAEALKLTDRHRIEH